jgi:hypothetical protein
MRVALQADAVSDDLGTQACRARSIDSVPQAAGDQIILLIS